MKRYMYIQPGGERGETNEHIVMTEEEILENEWFWWKERMEKKYGKDSPLITEERCIADWCTENWAEEWPYEEFKNLNPTACACSIQESLYCTAPCGQGQKRPEETKLRELLQDMKAVEASGHSDSSAEYREGWYSAIKHIEEVMLK